MNKLTQIIAFFIVIILAIIVTPKLVFANHTVAVSKELTDDQIIDISPYLYWVNDSDTILFSESIGHINQPHNFVFYIKNTSPKPLFYVISFGERYQNVNNISLHSLLNNRITSIEGYHNFTSLELLPNETKQVSFTAKELNREDPNNLQVFLVSEKFIQTSTTKMQLRQSFFLGLFAFVFLFNLILYFVTGWGSYLKYSLFIFFALLYFLYFFGILQEALPWVKSISHNLVRTWYSLIFISYFYFINDFGDYKKEVPKAYHLLNFGIVFKLCESIFNTIIHYIGWQFIYSEIYNDIILVFEIALMGFIVFYILKNNNLRGRIVILAASIMIIGGIIDQVFITKNYAHFYFMEIAVVVELLTFSVGLGYITKLFFQEKRESQQLYIEQLKENKLYQTQLNKELEAKVKQRTAELEEEKNNVVLKNTENELLLGEIHHRVKNNLQTINSLLGIQQRRLIDPHAIEAIEDSKNRILAMGLIHSHLYQNKSFSNIDFSAYVKELIDILVKAMAIKKIEVMLSIPPISLTIDNAIFLGLIINEFVVNSIKHAFKRVVNPVIEVSIFSDTTHTVVRFKDNGISKGLNFKKSNTFGWKMINTMCEQLHATPNVNQENGVAIDICVSKEIISIDKN